MRKIKITIIDDEIEFINDLSRGLEILGYEVSKAASGSHGIEVINRNKPDIVLCDYKLDDMDGTQIIAKSKANNPNTLYMMVTAYYDETFDNIFKKAGANNVIYKPVQLAELDSLIHKCIEAKER